MLSDPNRPRTLYRTLPRTLAVLLATVALTLGVVVATVPLASRAEAATLTPVTSFGANPGNLAMYAYVPDNLPGNAPLVVLLHGCTQDAAAYHANSGWAADADAHGYALVYAEQRTANNSSRCFNWFQGGDTARGSGEALSIRNMVSRAVSSYGLDASRTYVSGLSAGGAMTSEMLSAYPDVFAGGGIVAGIPTGCASGLVDAFSCMNPGRNQTPAQWGNAVRAKNPGWDGPWPRVAIWHGTADSTVAPANSAASRDQWTNVWGISRTPGQTVSLPAGTTAEYYRTGSGQTVVARYTVSGMGHGTPVDPGSGPTQCGRAGAYFLDTICSTHYTAQFWGIDGPGANPGPDPTPDPDPLRCVTANNYQHVTAGRAEHRSGYAYSRGGGDNLGLYNTYVVTSVEETSPGHWERAAGGC